MPAQISINWHSSDSEPIADSVGVPSMIQWSVSRSPAPLPRKFRSRGVEVGGGCDYFRPCPMNDPGNRIGDEAALRLVVEGTVAETGAEFFRALVKNLAAVMGTLGAWVTEYLPEQQRLRAHAFWLKGEFVENFEYHIAGTACAPVVEARKLIHIPDRLIELYPGDPDLVSIKAVSYLGTPLLGTDGSVIGHLSVLDDKPMPVVPRLFSLFEIFAARAAAESRRLKIEQQVRAREEELSALLESAMDAVVVLDAQMAITRVNPAAERLLGCTAEDLLGERLPDFLAADSVTRLEAFVRELDCRPAGQRQLWIPQSLTARRWDHSTFPAEATLSRFEKRGQTYLGGSQPRSQPDSRS